MEVYQIACNTLRMRTCTQKSMSSLNAARADNFYYPPDWEPGKGKEIIMPVNFFEIN